MFFNAKSKEQGFTFIEMIIYIAIFGLLISSFVSFGLSVSGIRNKNYAVEEVQANARLILAFLSDKIRSCEAVITPAPGGQSAVLELDMPDTSDNLVFNIASGTLYVANGAATPVAISSSQVYINSLVYSSRALENEKDNVELELSIKYRNHDSREYSFAQSLRTAVSTRL